MANNELDFSKFDEWATQRYGKTPNHARIIKGMIMEFAESYAAEVLKAESAKTANDLLWLKAGPTNFVDLCKSLEKFIVEKQNKQDA